MAKHSVRQNPAGLKALLEGFKSPFSLNFSEMVSFKILGSQNTFQDMEREGKWDPRMTQTLFLQTPFSECCPVLIRCSDKHGPPMVILRSSISVSFGCLWRTDIDKESHCQCSYWNLISRLQHITALGLPGNSELIIKPISLFMWLWTLLVQRCFMTLFLPKISVILWSQNLPVPWFTVTQYRKLGG